MDNIKIFALGGLDEDGRNMTVVEINDEIYIIDVGLRYPSNDQLGVEAIIPDFSYLVKNKEKVKALLITHAHDDVMGALPYLLKEIKMPVYTTSYTARICEDLLREHRIKGIKINIIKRNSHFKIGQRKAYAFSLTHSIPDTVGFAIDTSEGYIVHSGEYIVDFNVPGPSFTMNMSAISEIGKKGVFLLMSESVTAQREGFTSPKHRIEGIIERIFESTDHRILVTLYEQNIYRLIEVIEMAKRFKRKVYIYGDEQRKLLKHLEDLNYYRLPKNILISDKNFDNNIENVVVIISDIGPNVFRKAARIAMGEDPVLSLRSSDHVVIASPQVPGTENIASEMVNEMFKDGVSITNMSPKDVISMHASVEDLKMMISLLRPKYYLPLKGQYQALKANADIAYSMGIRKSNILVLDNGQIAEFKKSKLVKQESFLELESHMIDGIDHLDVSGLVLRDRRILGTDGVITVGVMLDQRSKKIIGGPDVQSRGVIYLKDAQNIMKEVGEILSTTIQDAVKEKKYNHLETRNEARDKISKYIFKETGKRPVILPVIIELRNH